MTKKRQPTSIIIGGVEFKIIYEDVIRDEDDKDLDNIYGMTHLQDKVIKISNTKNPTESTKNQTLFHEVIHAALGVSGLGDVLGDEKIEEGVVVCLENLLWQLVEFRKGVLK